MSPTGSDGRLPRRRHQPSCGPGSRLRGRTARSACHPSCCARCPSSTLSPKMTLASQLADPHGRHGGRLRRAAKELAGNMTDFFQSQRLSTRFLHEEPTQYLCGTSPLLKYGHAHMYICMQCAPLGGNGITTRSHVHAHPWEGMASRPENILCFCFLRRAAAATSGDPPPARPREDPL